MPKKIILEARINEFAMRDANPNMPWTPEEIAETAVQCRAAGASIVHFHPRNPDGSMAFDYGTYRDIVERIRARSDILIHPTLGANEREGPAELRIANILQLADDGLAPDLAPLDMGSTNLDFFDRKERRFLSDDKVYLNTTRTLTHFANVLRERGIKPQLVIWNGSMMGWADAFNEAGLVDEPLFMELSTASGVMGLHPANDRGLGAHLALLPEHAKIEWTLVTYGASIFPLIDRVVREGGHLSFGLGDYPYVERGIPTNAELVTEVAAIALAGGRETATPDETRAMLGMQANAFT